MAYKVINVTLTNTCNMGTKPFHKWIDRVCECNNMTLDAKSDPSSTSSFWARLNGNTLSSYLSSDNILLGTMKNTGTNYTHTGLSFFQAAYTNAINDLSKCFKLIVDDNNNLIYCSRISSNLTVQQHNGLFFTNGLVMDNGAKNLYSMGASPTKAGYFDINTTTASFPIYNGTAFMSEPQDNAVFVSDTLMRFSSNELAVRDHVKYIYSSRLNDMNTANYSINAFQIVRVGDKNYMHFGTGLYIEISQVTEETIEVT